MRGGYLAVLFAIASVACGETHPASAEKPPNPSLAEAIWKERFLDYEFQNENVYLVHASPDKIAEFNSAMADWKGGQIFDADAQDGYEFYWAYSYRTASQTREFLFTAGQLGLEITIGQFGQSLFKPEIRKSLDEIEHDCAAKQSRLFVLPDNSLVLDPHGDATLQEIRCLIDGLDKESLTRLLRSEIPAARESN